MRPPAPRRRCRSRSTPAAALATALAALAYGCGASGGSNPSLPAVPQPAVVSGPDSVLIHPAVNSAGTRRHTPAPDSLHPPPLAVLFGEATFYAAGFDGRRTASGIIFRNDEMYAAHRDFPFGTLLRVTNLANSRSVVVRIVDRVPPASAPDPHRILLDLSRRAAAELDFLREGRVQIRVAVLEWGAAPAP
jgi:rare lipoprotein A